MCIPEDVQVSCRAQGCSSHRQGPSALKGTDTLWLQLPSPVEQEGPGPKVSNVRSVIGILPCGPFHNCQAVCTVLAFREWSTKSPKVEEFVYIPRLILAGEEGNAASATLWSSGGKQGSPEGGLRQLKGITFLVSLSVGQALWVCRYMFRAYSLPSQ